MFFDSWMSLVRVLVVGTAAYAALVFMLRISGNRTLSKLNAFDLVVTVALGSTLATVLLSKEVALAEGILAFALLILLQYAITWLSVRSDSFQHLIKAEPVLVFYEGRFLEVALKNQRITRAEIIASLRGSGVGDLSEVHAAVLETDGSVSIIKGAEEPSDSTLRPLPSMRP